MPITRLKTARYDAPRLRSRTTRSGSIAATSAYIHFTDRDARVFAALEQSTADLLRDLGQAEATGGDNPVRRLRARVLFLGSWSREYAGLYKVLHERTLNRRMDLAFREELSVRAVAAIQACMDAGIAPADDAAAVAVDLRSAVHGAVSIRIDEPEADLPPWRTRSIVYCTGLLCRRLVRSQSCRRLVGVSIEHVF